MRPALTHVALHVNDLEACIGFYADYCALSVTHRREGVAWMAEPGREREFILVFLAGGKGAGQAADDYGHLGFALESRAAVDAIAEKAKRTRDSSGRPATSPGRPAIIAASAIPTAGRSSSPGASSSDRGRKNRPSSNRH